MSENVRTGLVIEVDGTIKDFTTEGSPSMLAALYSAIGCDLVDVVSLTDRVEFWVDDEGLYRQELNPYARALGQYLTNSAWQQIAGPVVVLGGIDDEGDARSLDEVSSARIQALINGARAFAPAEA